MPSDSPLTSCWRTTASCGFIELSKKGAYAPFCLSGLRRRADVTVLSVLDLENRHDFVLEVAIVVERDDSLECRQTRLLRVVANVLAGDRHTVLDQAADRVV